MNKFFHSKIVHRFLLLAIFILLSCEPIVIVRELPPDGEELPTPTPLPTATPTLIIQAMSTPTLEPTITPTPTPLPIFTAPAIELARFGQGQPHDVALSGRNLLAIATSIGLQLHDLNQRQLIRVVETGAGAWRVAFSPDGATLLAADYQGDIRLWRVSDGGLIDTIGRHDNLITDLAVSPDGQTVAVVDLSAQVRLWRIADRVLLNTLDSNSTGWLESVAYSPDGRWLAYGGSDDRIRLWQTDGSTLQTLTGHRNRIFDLAFTSDSQRLISSSNDSSLRIWSIMSQESPQILSTEGRGLSSLAIAPDGQRIAAGSREGLIRLWQNGTLQQSFQAHEGEVQRLIFAGNSEQLVSLGDDNRINQWQLADTVETAAYTLSDFTAGFERLDLSRNGQLLAVGDDTGRVRLWRLDNRLLQQTVSHGLQINDLEFSADGTVLATAADDIGNFSIRLWRTTDGALLRELPQTDRPLSLAFNPLGDTLLIGLASGQTLIWRLGDTAPLQTISGEAAVTGVAFDPTGSRLVTADRAVNQRRAADGAVLNTPLSRVAPAARVTYAPDGQLLAVANYDQIELLESATGQRVRTLQGHTDQITALDFDPSGSRLASASDDGTVQIWRISDGGLLQIIQGHTSSVTDVTFAADGQSIASASADGTARLWQVAQ